MPDDPWLRWRVPGPATTGSHRAHASATREWASPASEFVRERQRDRPHLALLGAFGHDRGARDSHVYPFSTYKRSIPLTFHDAWWEGNRQNSSVLKFCRANVFYS